MCLVLYPSNGYSVENFRIQKVTPDKLSIGETLLRKLNSAQTGITFKNVLFDETHTRNQITLNGSGVAAGDFNNDGLCDLYFCGLDVDNKLYQNLGNLRFKDVTEEAGVACSGRYSTGAAFIDINGDFFPELIVNSIGMGTLIFFNNQDGKFEDVTKGNGFNKGTAGMSIAAADMNNDQFLDIYITNYRLNALMDNPGTRFSFDTDRDGKKFISHVNGRSIVGTPSENRYVLNAQGSVIELGEVDAVYLNEKGRTFKRIQFTNSMFKDSLGEPIKQNFQDWGLSARFEDLNGDGLQDLYVCNDFETPDRIWLKKEDGDFHLLSDTSLNRISFFSMGVDFGDYNRDGLKDILVIDMLPISPKDRHNILLPRSSQFDEKAFVGPPQYSWNTLLKNTANETWLDVGAYSGLSATGWSWSVIFNDINLDGWEDVFITNGVERDGRDIDVSQKLASMRKSQKYSNEEMFDARSEFPTLNSPDVAYKNNGDGTFIRSPSWGFETRAVSHGMALADLDNDGDLEVVVNHQDQEASIFVNSSQAPRVQVRLFQRPPNTRGVGGIINFTNGSFNQIQEIVEGGRYLSDDQPIATFPVPYPSTPSRIEISWPDGSLDSLNNVPLNSIITALNLNKKKENPSEISNKKDRSQTKSFVLKNGEKTYAKNQSSSDNFAEEDLRDPHWIYAVSNLGPQLEKNRDSDELSYFWKGKNHLNINDDSELWGEDLISQKFGLSAKEVRSLLSIRKIKDHQLLIFGLSYLNDSRFSKIGIYDESNNLVYEHEFPEGIEVGKGTLVDIDQDSRDEIVIPVKWNYKHPAKAQGLYIFQSDSTNQWKIRDDWCNDLVNVGPVFEVGATDINGDGSPELIIPSFLFSSPSVFTLKDDRLIEVSDALGLKLGAGPWLSVSFVNHDGDDATPPAIIYGNIGLNNVFSSWNGESEFSTVFYDQSFPHIIEVGTLNETEELFPVQYFNHLVKMFPFLSRRISSRNAFGEMAITGFLPHGWNLKKIETLESHFFVPSGNGGYKKRELPKVIQSAAIRDVASSDFNQDGLVDFIFATGWDGRRQGDFPLKSVAPILLIGDKNSKNGFNEIPTGLSGLSIGTSTTSVALLTNEENGKKDILLLSDEGETFHFINAF